jgi:hypothetical protein
VQSSSHKAKSLVLVRLSLRVLVSAAKLNGTAKKLLDVLSGSHDASTFIRNVVLHASLGINRQLSFFIDGPSETLVIVTSIDVVGVVLGVVDVILRAVAAKSLGGNLELAGTVAKGHETKNTEKEADGLSRHRLDGTNIDGLRIVPKPVSEIDTRNVDLVELLAIEGTGL